MELTVVCLKVGRKYNAKYVNALYGGFSTHLRIPHRFICITDDPMGVACETVTEETGLPGWWAKLSLFARTPYGITGKILFCDLDNLIVGALDEMVESGKSKSLIAVEDFTHKDQFNSAFFMIESGSHTNVWEEFSPNMIGKIYGDQNWITPRVEFARWPQSFVASYKLESRQGPPPEAKVICFHGDPKPHAAGSWVTRVWERAAFDALLSGVN